MNNIEFVKSVFKSMTVTNKREFYNKCKNNKFRAELKKLGLELLIELICSSSKKNSAAKTKYYIEKKFNNKNMLSQKFIKYSYSLGN